VLGDGQFLLEVAEDADAGRMGAGTGEAAGRRFVGFEGPEGVPEGTFEVEADGRFAVGRYDVRQSAGAVDEVDGCVPLTLGGLVAQQVEGLAHRQPGPSIQIGGEQTSGGDEGGVRSLAADLRDAGGNFVDAKLADVVVEMVMRPGLRDTLLEWAAAEQLES
jgi:hypothetical protein